MLKDERFPHLEKKVGLLVVLALVAVIAVVIFIGIEQDLFSKKYELHFTVKKATGFSEGMPVKLSGFRVGRVKRLQLAPDARVRVDLQINRKYQHWIRDNSWARLTKEGVIGESVVEVMVGRPQEPVLEDGAEIFYEPTQTLDEMFEEIKKDLTPVLYQLRDFIAWVSDPDGEIRKTARHLESFSSGLPETRERVDLLLDRLKKDVADVRRHAVSLLAESEKRVGEIEPALQDAGAVMARLDGELPRLIESLDRILSNLSDISGEMRTLLEGSSGQISGVIDTAEDVLENSREISEAVKGIWPIRTKLPGKTPVMAPPDGFEGGGGDAR